jgi:hypothetical protein
VRTACSSANGHVVAEPSNELEGDGRVSRLEAESSAVVISHRVGLSTALPFVEALHNHGRHVRVYCLGDFAEQVRSLLPDHVEVVERSQISTPRRAGALRTATFALSNFDPGANPGQRQDFAHRSATGARLRSGILAVTRRLSPSRLNAVAGSIGGIGTRALPERDLWIVSFLTEPSLALRSGQRVITLIDSWDHPVRRTAGYPTDTVVGWNMDLALDWKDIQGARSAIAGAPLKLRYAADSYPLAPCTDKRLMFAVGTSSHTPGWQDAELRLAELVCRAAEKAGWEVLLKLKPTGGQQDWFEFARRWPNVEMTHERDAPTPMDYFLDDEYNETRLGELRRVRAVVNTVTTFGLDASCAGVPVLQLAGLRGAGLSGLASAQENFHIQKYLLRDRSNVLVVDEDDGESTLAAWLMDPDDRAHRYAENLRSWLVPESGFDDAIDRAVGRVLHGGSET